MAWQRELLDDMFELLPDGRRRYRTAYIGMPRKNGKSTLAAGLALFGLLMDHEPGAEVYSCAGDRKQASIVFSEARRMALADPELAALITPRQHHLEVASTNAVYRVLSADAALQQGLNPSFVIFDEVHVQPNDDLWDAMTLGSGTRRQPMIIGITTAGWDETSLAWRLYDKGRRIARGEEEDPSFFFRWWEPPTGADYRRPETWRGANPALAPGGFLKIEDFETTVRSTPESAFRRFRCNQWVQAETLWLPAGAWDACKGQPTLDPKLPVAVGIDISRVHDTTAVIVIQEHADGTVHIGQRFWANPYPTKDPRHDEWRVDLAEVRGHIRDLRERFPAPAGVGADNRRIKGPVFCYDPWGFGESASELESEGLAMLEVPQTDARLVPATRLLFDLIIGKRLVHDGNPTLREHMANVLAKQRGASWRIGHPLNPQKKVDGATALVTGLTELPEPTVVRRSVAFLA